MGEGGSKSTLCLSSSMTTALGEKKDLAEQHGLCFTSLLVLKIVEEMQAQTASGLLVP